jgi:hypothetical protein
MARTRRNRSRGGDRSQDQKDRALNRAKDEVNQWKSLLNLKVEEALGSSKLTENDVEYYRIKCNTFRELYKTSNVFGYCKYADYVEESDIFSKNFKKNSDNIISNIFNDVFGNPKRIFGNGKKNPTIEEARQAWDDMMKELNSCSYYMSGGRRKKRNTRNHRNKKTRRH